MRLPKFDRAATITVLAASVMTIVGATLFLSPWNSGANRVSAVPARAVEKPAERPVVDVVFALDTTGSMSGLLDSAKQKIWGIANQLATGQPRPIVRFGLVFYRDKYDAYVTEATPLTDDIDAVYEKLLTANAAGGGDNPENVNKALDIAINEMQWKSGPRVLKLVFVVGDAPPHDDYSDVPTTSELAKQAKKKGIIINTIRAGSQLATEVAWKAIAAGAGGEYASIAQDGGTVAFATPHDATLERLNRELADSGIAFGSEEERSRAAMRFDTRRKMKGEVAASAASVSGARGGSLGRSDLLSAIGEGTVDIAKLPAKAAPAEIREMDADERGRWVAKKQAERKAITAKIAKTSKARRDFLKKNKKRKADSFDDNVGTMLEKQAESIGVKLK